MPIQIVRNDITHMHVDAIVNAVPQLVPSGGVTYRGDRQGTRLNYEVVHDAVTCVRASEELPRQWKSRIEQNLRDLR